MALDVHTPTTFCPYCTLVLDVATLAFSDGVENGEYSVCIGCLGLLRFDRNLKLRVVSKEAYRRLCAEEPTARNAITILRKAIADAHTALGRPPKSIEKLQW